MRQEKLRAGGAVKRLHTSPTISTQTNAAHSWGVAVIILDIWPDASRDLIKAAIQHDIAEYYTGDIPAPVKWQNVDMRATINRIEAQVNKDLNLNLELDLEDQRRLVMADVLELMWFCLEEMQMGNSYLREVFNRCSTYLKDYGMDTPAYTMFNQLVTKAAKI